MDAGYGLRLMQGGVDRTGLASMADAIGNPGLDLIERRRQEQALADAIAAATASENIGDPSVTTTTEESPDIGDIVYSYGKSLDDKFESILTPLGQEKYMQFKDAIRGGVQTAGDMFSSFMEDPNPLKVDPLSVPVDTDGDGVIGQYEQSVADMENELKMMDIRNSLFYNVVDPTKQAFENFMSSPEMKFTTDIFTLPYSVGKDMFEDKFINPYFKADGGPVYGSLEEAIADQKAERLAQNVEMFESRMDEAPNKPSLEQYIEDTKIMQDETPSIEFLDPPIGIGGNTIQETPPIGIGGTITDDMLMTNYGMPVGTGNLSGELKMPFESDPTLQLMLEQQLADDLSLNADVSLMEDRDPLLNLMLTKTF